MDDLSALLDSLDVAVAEVVAAERLRPCNAAMRALLRTLGAPDVVEVPIVSLGLHADEGERLARGEPIELGRGGFAWSLHRRGRWLLANDLTALRQAESLVLAGARAGALARVAGTFVHDLNNHLNLGLALFGQLRTMTTDEQERQLCDALAGGAQLAAQLARTLARLLQRDAGGRDVVEVEAAMTEALAAVAKLCAQREIVVSSRLDAGARVRGSVAEVTGLYVQWLLALAELRPRSLRVVLELYRSPIAGGRLRPCARAVATLHGVTPEGRRTLAAAALAPPGSLRDLVASGHHGQALPQAVLLAFRLGGEFLVADVGDAVEVTCSLPAVATA